MNDPKPRKKKPRPKSAAQPTFETSLARLEQIVRDLETGELGLTESLQRYEDGVNCLKLCYQQLEQVEQRIELLTGFDGDGRPRSETIDESDLSLEAKADARSRRRSRPARPEDPGKSDRVDDPPTLF